MKRRVVHPLFVVFSDRTLLLKILLEIEGAFNRPINQLQLRMSHHDNTRSDGFVTAHVQMNEQYGSKYQQDNHSLHETQFDALKTSCKSKCYILISLKLQSTHGHHIAQTSHHFSQRCKTQKLHYKGKMKCGNQKFNSILIADISMERMRVHLIEIQSINCIKRQG